MPNLYKHTKTGNIYRVIGKAINATNEQSGQEMMIYTRADISGPIYTREATEFHQRFVKEPNRCRICETTENLSPDGGEFRCKSLNCVPY